MGDGGGFDGQLLTSPNGKLLRIDPRGATDFSYSIPADNPFVDGPGSRSDEIYAYGLRNPYRFSFDRATGDLAVGDVGEKRWEEVDFADRGTAWGRNFGWFCFEGTHTTAIACSIDHAPPVLEYAHPAGGPVSVIGGDAIRDAPCRRCSDAMYLLTSGTSSGGFRAPRFAESGATAPVGLGVTASFVVSFGEDACSHIYVAEIGGTVSRLEPTSGPFPCKPQPHAPQITDTDPDSPADDSQPEVKGSAPSDSTVSIYDNADCIGDALATGLAASFSAPGLTISVADGSSTGLHAIATVNGQSSPCSSNAFLYVDLPSVTAPPPPSSSSGPTCHEAAATLEGTRGKDRFTGTPGPGRDRHRSRRRPDQRRRRRDMICARAAATRSGAAGGRDRLYGGPGRDVSAVARDATFAAATTAATGR